MKKPSSEGFRYFQHCCSSVTWQTTVA